MNEKTKHRSHVGLIILLVVIVLLALVCAAPFILNALSDYEYDDYAALTAANTERLSLAPDADGEHLLFRMDKTDVYSMLLEDGTIDQIRDALGGRATLEQIGYSLTPEQAQVRMSLKLFGFIPVQLQANAAVEVGDCAVRAQLTDVQLASRIRISAEKVADLTGSDALTDPYEFSLTEYTVPLRAERVRIENDGVAISSALLAQVLDEVKGQNEVAPRLLRLYFGNDSAAAQALYGDGRADFIRAAGSSLEALRDALRDVCAFGGDDYRRALAEELSELPVDLSSGLAAFPQLRQAQLARVAEAQTLYREAQMELRHDYWYRNVILSAAHLLSADGLPLEDRLPADWEARVVLQYNENYDAIVKTNEGNPRLQVPIPGLPMMSELPRDSWDALPSEGDGPFDLSLALRLPSGIPAVVFLTAEDEFGLAVISEALFAEIRENERIPILSSAEIVAAPRDTWIRMVDTDPIGNYVGVP